MCFSASNSLHVFYCCFCCWFLVLMHCGQTECMGLFLFSYICCGLLCALRYDQFWRRFHGLLRRMYIVQKSDEIFCRHQLGLFDIWCDLVLGFLYLFFVWNLSIGDGGILGYPTNTVLEFIYVFRSFRVWLMKLGALTLGTYRLIIVTSFWCIYPFFSMSVLLISFDQCRFEVYFVWGKYCYPCLFLGKFCLVNLFPAFHSQPVLISVNEVGLL
jgi:hypothetical protein